MSACQPTLDAGSCSVSGAYDAAAATIPFSGTGTALYHNNGYDGLGTCTGSFATDAESIELFIGNTGPWNSGTKTGLIGTVRGQSQSDTITNALLTGSIIRNLGLGVFVVGLKVAYGIFGPVTTGTGTLTIQCPYGFSITSPLSMPDGVVGTVYPTQTFVAANGTPTLVYSVSVGSLPPGLSLSSAGVLSGTPTTPGRYEFTVLLTDAIGCTSTSADYVIRIPTTDHGCP